MAATMGLPGETDYVAANEYLHAAATLRPQQEYAIAWPAWKETGILATSPLVRVAEARRHENTGLSPREGATHFLGELAVEHDGTPGVHYGGSKELSYYLRRVPKRQPPRRFAEALPDDAFTGFLGTCLSREGEHTVWQYVFDLERDSYLEDHLVNGRPTVPATVELEMAAQAAASFVPGSRVHAFSDARFSSFLHEDRGRPGPVCRIAARLVATKGPSAVVDVRITSDFVHANGTTLIHDREHSRVTVHLISGEQPPIPPRPLRRPDTKGVLLDDPYVRSGAAVRLSGVFDVLRDCRGDAHSGSAVLRLKSIPEASVFRGFRTPVISLDALARAAQLIGTSPQDEGVAVPKSISWIGLYTAGNDGDLATAAGAPLTLSSHTTGPGQPSDCAAVTAEGDILLWLKGMEGHRLRASDSA